MHHVLRKSWDCWSAGTPLQIIEKADGGTAALVRINRTTTSEEGRKRTINRRSEQVVIPLEYITERRRG